MAETPLMDPETGEIDEDAIAGIIQLELQDCDGLGDTELDGVRERNTKAYLGDKYGNERDGYSQYVDRTAYEVVESYLPYLMKVFHGNDEAVTFSPSAGRDPQDQKLKIEQARQATDYINHIYNIDNPGYLISQAVIKDALVQRLGWWKHYWVEEEREEAKRFSGLTQEEVLALGNDQKADVRVEVVSEKPGPQGKLFDVKVKRQWKEGRVRVEAVPPEQVIFARRAKHIDDTPFIAQYDIVPRADLIADGYDADKVMGLPRAASTDGLNRRGRYGNTTQMTTSSRNDAAMEEVEVLEAFLRVDLDGDGIAEWVRVMMAGSIGEGGTGTVLDVERCDGHPFTPLTPIMLPHQIDGLCPVDSVEDLQRLKTEATRQMIDGLFLTNHPRWEVVEGKVDEEQMAENQPGDMIRVKMPGSITRLDSRWEGAQAMPLMAEFEKLVERRSGISPHGSVQAASSMTQHAEGTVDSIMQASMARQELIARNMAELGFTRLYRNLLKLVTNHQDRERMVRLRGEFVPMDPTKWDAGMDVEVNPGVGAGRSQIRQQVLMQVGAAMERLMTSGFRGVGEEQIYNWFVDVLKAADMPAIDPYVMDVTKMDPPQPPPPPDPTQDIVYIVEEMKQRYALVREQMKDKRERDEQAQDLAIKAEEIGSRETIERAKAMQKANDAESAPPQPAQPGKPGGGNKPTAAGSVSPQSPSRPAETFFPGGAAQ